MKLRFFFALLTACVLVATAAASTPVINPNITSPAQQSTRLMDKLQLSAYATDTEPHP